jgi:hypothetical protein
VVGTCDLCRAVGELDPRVEHHEPVVCSTCYELWGGIARAGVHQTQAFLRDYWSEFAGVRQLITEGKLKAPDVAAIARPFVLLVPSVYLRMGRGLRIRPEERRRRATAE